MLRTTKLMKDKYEKIQKYLFSMIPEKWEEIHLYASVDQKMDGKKTGELYFYYLPKGILKKKPVNVYEIPQKFNINEEEYLKIVQELYNCIKDLNQDFIDMGQNVWNSVTISIADYRFKVEYDYSENPKSEKENEERRVIWRYKHLGIGGDKKEERKILDNYFANKNKGRSKKETYETGLYLKTSNNGVSFDKEEVARSKPQYEKEEKTERIINEEFEKTKRKQQNMNKLNTKDEPENKGRKNQILNM